MPPSRRPAPASRPTARRRCSRARTRRPARRRTPTLARIAELEAAIREAQPVTPADIKGAIRWWIGDSLPEYARALASPEAMRAWIRRQASGPASRPGKGSYDSAIGRYYSASPEGLRTSTGSDTRTPPFILWEEIPAWIQPGLPASLRDRLAAAGPRQAPGRKRTAAASPPAGAADPAGQADDPLPRPLREAIDAAWAAIEAAPPPSPAELDHARTVYRDTGTATRTPARQSREDRPDRDPGTAATSRTPPGPAAPRPARPLTARTSCPARQQPAHPPDPRPSTTRPYEPPPAPGPGPAAHRNRRLRRSRPAPRSRSPTTTSSSASAAFPPS